MESNNSSGPKKTGDSSFNKIDDRHRAKPWKWTKKDDSKSLRKHDNALVRFFARTGYTIWIIVMAVGLILAFIVSLFLV